MIGLSNLILSGANVTFLQNIPAAQNADFRADAPFSAHRWFRRLKIESSQCQNHTWDISKDEHKPITLRGDTVPRVVKVFC